MKFSLRLLLSLVLLAAIFANGWRMQFLVVPIREEIVELSLASESRANSLVFLQFEDRKLVYQRIADSYKTHQTEFAAAEPKFQELIEKYGQIDIGDESKFAIIGVPTFDEKGLERHRWRLFVPKGRSLNLAIDFVNGESRQPLNKTEVFAPSVPWSTKLPEGESDIRFNWLSGEAGPVATLTINGETRYEFSLKGASTGHTSNGSTLREQAGEEFLRQGNLLQWAPSLQSNSPDTRTTDSVRLSITSSDATGDSE